MTKKIVNLFAGDVILSIAALVLAILIRFVSFNILHVVQLEQIGLKIFIFSISIIVAAFLMGLYGHENFDNRKEIFIKVFIGILLSFCSLSVLFFVMPSLIFGRGFISISLVIFGLFQFAWHSWYKLSFNKAAFAPRILIVGTGPLAEQIGNLIVTTDNPFFLVGYLRSLCSSTGHVQEHLIKGEIGDVLEVVKKEKIQIIVVALLQWRGRHAPKELVACKFTGVEVININSFYEMLTGKMLLENMIASDLIYSRGFHVTSIEKSIKGLVDIFLSCIGLILVMPLLPLIALAIKLDSRGPVLFKQTRIGENEKEFILYKFRTMAENAESSTGAVWADKYDSRITRVGRFLRNKRLDEIPQLFNVLKGDMSLIGPRPERPEFVRQLKEVIPYYSERHFVKPGVTGWAQVKYSYGASTEDAFEKLRYDLYYIKHISLFNDILIILETIKVVLLSRGAR